MATKKPAAKKSFYEVVFLGKPKVVRAFMKGFVMGTLEDATVIYRFDSGIFHEGKVEKMAEMEYDQGIQHLYDISETHKIQ